MSALVCIINTVSQISVDNDVSWSGQSPCLHNRDRLSVIDVLNASCNGGRWIVYTFLNLLYSRERRLELVH